MGGRGSSRGGISGGTRISVPEGKKRRSGGRPKKLPGEPGNPRGDELPFRPAGGKQTTEQ
jgi:hypothetical protein